MANALSPGRESIIDVMNACSCNERQAINLLKVTHHPIDHIFWSPFNNTLSIPTMILKELNSVTGR